jgi:hypothetical protein
MPSIDLKTNDDRFVLQMRNIEDVGGECFRCDLFVRSGGFSCRRPFYFDDSHFPDAVASLRQMNTGTIGEATIKARWEDDYLTFQSDKLGHVFVTGELFEYADFSQSLKFGFVTDQTVLGPLVRDLESLLSERKR